MPSRWSNTRSTSGALRPALLAILLFTLVGGCQSAAPSPTLERPATPLGTAAAGTPNATLATPPLPTATVASSGPTPTGGGNPWGPFPTTGLQNRPDPDPVLTPGVPNPNVTQATIGSTVCLAGWTVTVRPPESYTEPLKIRQITEYGYTDTSLADYEEDHLISLELGGSPRDPGNLWPEPRTAHLPDGTPAGATAKDGLENFLHRAICKHTLTLAAAQHAIADDWVSAWIAAGKP